ncbi:MAG TPA: MlaD family protein [Thermoleophilaceae bacterium]|nr:MlaD family protein [Thermoleophilaceae bacterium]
MSRRGTASIVASPVLVGAVTTLIIVVSVFLAYNANQGLPFVPTYDLKAEIPSGANLVAGNQVTIGGFRVGQVARVTPRTVVEEGVPRTVAVVDMELDKTAEPLPIDTQVLVRPRSALGLKYVELTPGNAEATFKPGDTIPLAQAGDPIEFDDFFNTFDAELRDDSRTALAGFGDAFAGRGQSINQTIQELPSFFASLTAVMDILNDPETNLDEFFVEIGQTSAQVAPVDDIQAALFTNMADTFEAFSRDPAALQAAIEAAPPTLQEGIESFPVQRPFLRDFADLSRRLQPAAQTLEAELPTINAALAAGTRTLPQTPPYSRELEETFAALVDLGEDPNTLLALQDLDTLNDVTGPLLRHVSPYQTVCNYFNYFFVPLAEHQSEIVPGGTIQRVLIRHDPGVETEQYNRFGAFGANRPADIPINQDPDEQHEFYALHGQPYQPAIDRQGRADCQNGQNGFPDGPFVPQNAKYPPAVFDNTENPAFPGNDNAPDADTRRIPDGGGGSSTVGANDSDYVRDGGRAGPTFDPNSPDGIGVRDLDEVR